MAGSKVIVGQVQGVQLGPGTPAGFPFGNTFHVMRTSVVGGVTRTSTDVRVRIEGVIAPAFGSVSMSGLTVGFAASMSGTCTTGYNVDVTVNGMWRRPSTGAVTNGGNSLASLTCAAPTFNGTVTLYRGNANDTFDGLVFRSQVNTGDTAWYPYVAAEKHTTWVPEGNALWVPAVMPGLGTVTRNLTCKGADGIALTLSDAVEINVGAPGEWDYPELACPDGMVTDYFGATWTPGTPGSDTQALIPETQTQQWVRDIPSRYPECLDDTCPLELYAYWDCY